MHAYCEYIAYVKSTHTKVSKVQYTIRDVPLYVNEALRQRAKTEGKSLNQVAVEALTAGAGLGDKPVKYRDLDHLVGTWVEDPAFDEIIREMDRIDPEMWK